MSDELFDKIMYNILQVTHPVILNVINHNIQDVTLLFSVDEIKALRSENNKIKTEAKEALVH
jgi:hypothetical protein